MQVTFSDSLLYLVLYQDRVRVHVQVGLGFRVTHFRPYYEFVC